MSRRLGIYVIIVAFLLFIALTWRFWQFEIIGYRLGTKVGEYGRVDTYITEQLVAGQTKEEVFHVLESIPHELSNGFTLQYVPDDTSECFHVDFPRWLIIYHVESSRAICFDDHGILNYIEIHTS